MSMLYALGAYNEYAFLYPVDTVKITIIQPRLDSISEDTMTIEELLIWGEVIKPIAKLAFNGDGVRPTGEYFSAECKGHFVMTASSEMRPQIVDINMNEIINPTEIYSGMYARVSIRFFPYFNSGKKGIGCGLCNVQKLEDGEPLGARINAADDFGGSGGYGSAPIQALGYMNQPIAYPQQNIYNPQVPAYIQQPIYPQKPTYLQSQAQPIYQSQPAQFDPITGTPVIGRVMGI